MKNFHIDKLDELSLRLQNSYKEQYVSYFDLKKMEKEFSDCLPEQVGIKNEKKRLLLKLHFIQFWRLAKLTRKIRFYLNHREKLNKKFIKQKQREGYEVEGHKLDPQQIEAVVACEDAGLFLAPAGSGKTASLLAKVEYLNDELKIPAEQILIIAFTNKVVAELKERVANKNVEIRTFHSLGNKILKNYKISGKNRKVISDKEITKFFHDTIKDLRGQNSEYARRYDDYLLFYQSVPIDLNTLKNEREKIEFNRTFLRRTLKEIAAEKEGHKNKKLVSCKEYIKSKEEQNIADWLFLNQIDDRHKHLYEHANISDLKKNLNYIVKRRNEEEIAALIAYDNKYRADMEALEALFISVMQLQKSEKIDLKELKNRITKIENNFIRERSLKFFNLYAPLFEKYTKYLKDKNMYDFADMLGEATDIIKALPKNSLNYEYILVDEAQDLSTSKYLLLKAILEKCRKVKLFAVGDDWQSIYRFAGSNLKILDDFEKIFGYQTYRGLIELTYRFGQPTAKISNKFIQKNPYQSKKNVTTHSRRKTPIEIKLAAKNEVDAPRDYEAVNEKLGELYDKYGDDLSTKRIQIISRYNRDIYRLVDQKLGRYKNAKLTNNVDGKVELEWRIAETGFKLKIPFCSMHKAKGITRDIVFVINMNSGMLGMPATRGDDPVMSTMLTKLDPYPFAEERRLFYVAITRATEKTILVAEANQISNFVYEIGPELEGMNVKICPRCKTGILTERQRSSDGKKFYGCSNFINGCKYSE